MKDFLSQVRLFQGVSLDHLNTIYAHSETKTFRKGEGLFRKGDLAAELFVLQRGMVKLFNVRPGTGKEELVCLIKPGQIFCLAPVLSRDKLHINAEALKNGEALVIPEPVLQQLIEDSHAFARNVISHLADKECQMCEEVCSLSLSTTRERLARYLLLESQRFPVGERFDIPLNQSQLASHLGTVRETISRDLSALKKLGVIDYQQKKIRVLDREGLTSLADGSLPIMENT